MNYLKKCLLYCAVIFFYVLEEREVDTTECTIDIEYAVHKYTCKNYQYCCGEGCCDEVYALWYVWVLFVCLILFCCFITIIIRKKKQRKNRISHSVFLERLRERAEQRAREQLQEELLQQQQQILPGIIYNNTNTNTIHHTQNQTIGIGGSTVTNQGTPLNNATTQLFMARAPPPYSARVASNASLRNDHPPSYDSIFT